MASGVLPAAAPLLNLPAPAERGSTRLADRVLARIASRAAVEALAPHARDGRRLQTPRASAKQGRHGTVTIRVGLDVPYPVDLAVVSREVHGRIVERLNQLAGTEAPKVSLVVERLVPAAPSGGLL